MKEIYNNLFLILTLMEKKEKKSCSDRALRWYRTKPKCKGVECDS